MNTGDKVYYLEGSESELKVPGESEDPKQFIFFDNDDGSYSKLRIFKFLNKEQLISKMKMEKEERNQIGDEKL